ncbi:Uu.00g095460.m01.CDS01 [Anthostomella pinea]|uniref:Uu.00g095460.m01.CDS01 n=1 Tax=Anthostomella pinea TaxID=933095 RepID=A0AAI8VCR4_9PEZI|nr:Uu.00g095460.m01.CDS01 [Anthostomella pinea]
MANFVPPTPSCQGSVRDNQYSASRDSASNSSAGVRSPSYRRDDLYHNGIGIRRADEQLPNHVSHNIAQVLQAPRSSPSPSPEQMSGYMQRLEALGRGCTEEEVKDFLCDTVFPTDSDPVYGRRGGLETSKSVPMLSYLVPALPQAAFRVTQPEPDLLYGYSGDANDGAFTRAQHIAQAGLDPRNPRSAEAQGGTRGDLWVAANQCAGAGAACLNAADKFNTVLAKCQDATRVDALSYAVGVDNNIAQLFISSFWPTQPDAVQQVTQNK